MIYCFIMQRTPFQPCRQENKTEDNITIKSIGGSITGIVSKVESKDVYVLMPETGQTVRCYVRGKFKNEYNLKKDKLFKVNITVVGDEVEFDINKDGTGFIHKIEPRRNYLSRKAPRVKGAGYRGERLEQVIAANVDNLFVVSSALMPKFNNKLIDRIIVAGESSHLKVNLVVNKMDLSDEETEAWIEIYNEVGYNVIPTSIMTGEGIEELKGMLHGRKNLFWGHSGVGKSSLLNAMFPFLNLKTGDISTYTMKGKHTTVTSVMTKVDDDTYIIDTPGIREIDPYGITRENLSHYFVDFLPYIENCRFNTCTHFHEPGCGVIEAVEKEEIIPERYNSYISLLETIEDDMVF